MLSPCKKAFLILLFLAVPRELFCRATSFDALSYRPDPAQGLYLTTGGTDLLGKYQWTAGFHLDYAREPLSAVAAGGGTSPVVRDLFGGHLSGAVGLLDWLEVGLNPNVALVEKFFDPVTGAASTRLRLGDTQLRAKFRILSRERWPVGIALIPYVDFPSGSGASFVGNNSFAGGGQVAVETKRLEERLTFAMNLGYYFRDGVSVIGTPFDDLLTFSTAGNFLVTRWMELIAEFRGGTTVSDLFASTGTPFEGGGGAKYFIGRDRRWQVTTAVAAGVGSGLGNPSVRGVVGIAYTPPRPVRGVELQESVKGAFQVYELEDVDEMEELKKKCPEKKNFNPERDDPRCVKLYLRQ